MTIQNRVAEARRAPKRPGEGEFAGPLNYAYHFDATRVAEVLSEHARALGVEHLQGLLTGVALERRGRDRAGRDARARRRSTADLYIDCTGFRAELIGGALGVPFKPVRRRAVHRPRAGLQAAVRPAPTRRCRAIPSPRRTRRDGPGTSGWPARAGSAASIRATHMSDERPREMLARLYRRAQPRGHAAAHPVRGRLSRAAVGEELRRGGAFRRVPRTARIDRGGDDRGGGGDDRRAVPAQRPGRRARRGGSTS